MTTVTVTNLSDKAKSRTFDAMVDTGATFLTLPLAWKSDLGLFENIRSARVQIADKTLKTVEVCGPVTILVHGFQAVSNEVAFFEELSEPLLGCIPLGQSGIVVDMMRHRLLQVDAFDLKALFDLRGDSYCFNVIS